MDKYIGRLLDNRYEILEVLGTGGMAVVYKARCHRLNRLVAIKILKDDYLEDEDFRRRFHAESQAVAMLGHPNIVSVYDVSTTLQTDYIVMELIDGISLKQYMEKKGVLNWKETLHFAMQIAKALEHAHSRGIVHRDIKPHNIMVLKNGSVKVADFGIARVMSKGNTLTKEALGSVHYISPEQARGGRVDVRSDIYSLGVVMYEMMSGRPPYDGDSPVSVAIQHINGGAVMPSTLNPNIPGGLEQIIMKAMAHEPDSRYESAAAMLTDMDEFRKDPAVLFDYNTPPLDEVINLPKPPLVLEPEQPRTTAEKIVEKADSQRRRRKEANDPERIREARRRRQAEEDARRDHMATVAIVVCSIVAVIAIGIFLVVLFGGGVTTPQSQQVTVPNLVGEYLADAEGKLPEGLSIRILNSVYSEEQDAGKILSQEPKDGEQIAKGNSVVVVVSLGQQEKPIYMPKLKEMDQAKAEEQLANLSLNLDVKVESVFDESAPVGQVLRTKPAAEEALSAGQEVILYVSKGPEIIKAGVPRVVGMDVDKAMSMLKTAGFGTPVIDMVYSNMDENEVVWQSVEPNAHVDVNTIITLEVSKGPEVTKDPSTDPSEGEDEEQPTTTRTIVIALPDGMVDPYTLTITHDGEVVHEVTVLPDTVNLEVALTGSGVQYYKINIPGLEPWIEEVDFTQNIDQIEEEITKPNDQ